MPNKVFEKKQEDKMEYNIGASELTRVASHYSRINYLNTLNFTQMIQESQKLTDFPDTYYTYDPEAGHEQPVEAKDAEVVESNEQLMAEALTAEQQNTIEKLDETLSEIALNKFNAIVEPKLKQSKEYLANIKQQHPNDYDKLRANLEQNPLYKEYYNYWDKYFSELMKECVAAAEAEYNAQANSLAYIAAAENKKAAVTAQKQAPEVVDTDKIEIYKYVPKHISANMVVNQDLKNKIIDILTTESYKSIQKSHIMYYTDNNKHSAERNEELNAIEQERKQVENEFVTKIQTITDEKEKNKAEREYHIKVAKLDERKFEAEKSVEIFNYRKELLEKLQSAHNMLAPQRSFEPDRFELMKENVENNKNNVTNEILADILLLEMSDKIIPEIANTLALRVQEMLLMNDKPNFNIEKESLEKLLNKITEKSKLLESVKAANQAVNGRLEITKSLISYAHKAMMASRKKDEEYVYDAEKFVALRQKVEENKQNNVGKMNQADYIRIGAALDTIEVFERKVAAKEEITTQDRNNLRNAQKDLRDIKKLATVEEKLNKKTSTLFKANNGIRLTTDYLIADFVESASNAYARGSLSSFEYTQEDVKTDIERMKKFVQNNYESQLITVELLDAYTVRLQKKRKELTDPKEIEELNKKVLNDVVDCAIIAEKDEIAQEFGKASKEDEKMFDEHQNRFAKVLQNSEEVLRTNKAEKLSRTTVENMKL